MFGRGRPAPLAETPRQAAFMAADGRKVPLLEVKASDVLLYNSSFDPQGCIILAETFLGFKMYFTPLQPV